MEKYRVIESECYNREGKLVKCYFVQINNGDILKPKWNNVRKFLSVVRAFTLYNVLTQQNK